MAPLLFLALKQRLWPHHGFQPIPSTQDLVNMVDITPLATGSKGRLGSQDATPPRSPAAITPITPTIQKQNRAHITIDTVIEKSDSKQEPDLPPRDSGKAAISMLLAVLLLDSSTYGILLIYGVFQEYYQTKFVDHSIASWIGVLSGGIPFLGAPAVTWCCQKYTVPRQYYIWVGLMLCVLSLLASAFINVLPGLIVMQGLVYGTGALLVSIPELIILNTWFEKRRGIAYGIIFAGADLIGVAYTFLATFLLNKHGLRTTMLVFAGLTFVLGTPSILLLRERPDSSAAPPSSSTTNGIRRRRSSTRSLHSGTKTSPSDLPFSPSLERKGTWPVAHPKKRYYQRSVFYLFTIINLLQSLAWYLPFIYLPSFITQLGYSRNSAATVLAVGNFAMVLGDLSFGELSDKFHVNSLIIISTTVSAVSAFVLWGFVGSGTKSFGAVVAFVFLFGSFGGGFIALWARMGTVFGEKDSQMVYSTLCFGRGVGGILSGPISQVLLRTGTPKALQTLGKGPYGGIIMFVGMCTAGAAIMGVCAVLALWWKKEHAEHIEKRRGEELQDEK